jgi:hypothetical protein
MNGEDGGPHEDEDEEEDEPRLSVEEFVEYCRTQARLLSGSVETMSAEADDLLDEIDEGVAEIRDRLEEGRNVGGPAASASGTESTVAPGEGVDVDAIEGLETDLEEKQAIVETKRARIGAFQELIAGYTDLAEELRSDVDDGRRAMDRVVEFEAERDAPAYFEERMTVYEAAARETDGG